MPSSQLPWVLDSQVPSHPPGALRLVERAEHVQPNCFSLAVISRFNTISRHRTRIQKVKETTPCSPAPPGLASSCPGSQPLPSPIPRSSQQSGPQARVSAHCLFTPPRCKLPLPKHDRCNCYSVCSSQDKSVLQKHKAIRDADRADFNRSHLPGALLCHTP